MTPEQIAAKGAFVRVLREYADRANDNYSGKVAVPEHVLRDAATCIEDQRAHLDTLTAAVEAARVVASMPSGNISGSKSSPGNRDRLPERREAFERLRAALAEIDRREHR